MGFPKDPAKREAYQENMRRKLYERLADPEKKRLMDEGKREAAQRPEVKEHRSHAQRKWREEADPAKLEADKEKQRASFQRPEVIEAISQAQKKRFTDPEQRQTNRRIAQEAWANPEVKERYLQSHNARWANPEQRQLASERTANWFTDPEHRRATSEATKEAMKEVIARPEYRETMRQSTQSRWDSLTSDERDAWIAALRAGSNTPEARERWEKAMLMLRASPEYNEALARGKAASWKNKNTDIELIVKQLLDALEVAYEPQKHFGRYVADFYVPSKSLIIECDGEYWHSLPGVKERDARKDQYLHEKGYRVLRLSSTLIYKGDFTELEKTLEEQV